MALSDNRLGRLIAFAVMAFCVAWMCMKSASEALLHASDLTLDNYSEADFVRSAARFADEGLWKHAGIPDVAYGDLFAKQGGKFDKQENCKSSDECFYTHAPPGGIYIVYVFDKLGSPTNLFPMRIFGVAFGGFAFFMFLRQLAKRWGPWRAAALAVCLTQIPMMWNNLHGIAYHGYITSVLLLQMAVLLRIFGSPGRVKLTTWALLFLNTYVQGWLAYDYIFLCTFAPLAIWLFREDYKQRPVLKKMAVALVLSGAGFALAQISHLLQNVAFFGSFHGMWADFAQAGRKRTVGEGSSYHPHFALGHPFGVWITYWMRHVTMPQYFDGSFFGWFLAILAVLLHNARRVVWRGARRFYGFARGRRVALALLVALFAASGWGTMLPQHAYVHTHIVPRQFFFPSLIMLMALLNRMRVGPQLPPKAEGVSAA